MQRLTALGWPAVALLVFSLAPGTGCSRALDARHAQPGPPPEPEQATPDTPAERDDAIAQEGAPSDLSGLDMASRPPSRGVAAGARPASKVAPLGTANPPAPLSVQPVSTPEPAPVQRRRVHYDGHVKLVATKPEGLLGRAEQLTKEAGGYVESLSGHRLVVRVPVASFRALFERLLALSEVLQQRITARDITDAYQAVQLRLRVLQASRTRLMELLAKVFREHEKLALLGQIKRLTEQIDQLELQLQTLARLADYSRITVEAAPRPQPAAGLAQQDLGAFRWIGRLSPFRRVVSDESDRFEMPVPKGMVELDHDDSFWGGDPWVAQSADGVTLWTMERENNPRGTSQFWHEALVTRLTERYPAHKSYRIGAFHVLELREEVGQRKYRYLVAVRVDDDELHVVEIYYPSKEHQERHNEAVKQVLERS